jgi:hypothetical protein
VSALRWTVFAAMALATFVVVRCFRVPADESPERRRRRERVQDAALVAVFAAAAILVWRML